MSRFRVVVTDFAEPDYDVEDEVFAASGLDIDLVPAEECRRQGLGVAGAGADALLVQFATIDQALIQSLTSCRVISRYGVGVDMVDLDAAGAAGIPVTNVPDYCIDEVSTQTIGFVLDLNRRTHLLDRYVHQGRWGQPPPCTPPRRLAGQVLGIVGLGAIGSEVARKAAALGLEVLAHDPYADPGRASAACVGLVPLEELLHRSDYVTLHCPLNAATRGLLGSAELNTMKPTAYLLNLSRGPVVDQDALVAALSGDIIAGAALDVLAVEPPAADDPLLALDQVLVTPHSSSWSLESALQLRREAALNVVAALSGSELRSVVNRAQLNRTNRQAATKEGS